MYFGGFFFFCGEFAERGASARRSLPASGPESEHWLVSFAWANRLRAKKFSQGAEQAAVALRILVNVEVQEVWKGKKCVFHLRRPKPAIRDW